LFEETSFDFFIDENFRIYLKEVNSQAYSKLNNVEYETIDFLPGFQKQTKQLFGKEFYLQLESSDISNIFLPSKNYPVSDFSAPDLITECFAAVSQKNIWVTSYSILIDWINRRKDMNVDIEQLTDENMLTIEFSYSGEELADQVGLLLSIPSSYKNLEMIGNDYSLRFDHKLGLYDLLIPFIKPYQTLLIDLRYKQ
jgi:hypothetical protein